MTRCAYRQRHDGQRRVDRNGTREVAGTDHEEIRRPVNPPGTVHDTITRVEAHATRAHVMAARCVRIDTIDMRIVRARSGNESVIDLPCEPVSFVIKIRGLVVQVAEWIPEPVALLGQRHVLLWTRRGLRVQEKIPPVPHFPKTLEDLRACSLV